MHKNKLIFEVCANGLQSAINAQMAGASRIELCENLEVGGLTPAKEVIRESLRIVHIPVHVLIRPREGDFCYTGEEFNHMKESISFCKSVKAAGVVFGILTREMAIDEKRCAELIALAKPLSVTFHRAFDVVKEPLRALEILAQLGYRRVLTSGQQENALKGADLISKLVKHADGRISILAGGGITEKNIADLVKTSGTNEFHFSAKQLMADGGYVSDLHRIRNIINLALNTWQLLSNDN